MPRDKSRDEIEVVLRAEARLRVVEQRAGVSVSSAASRTVFETIAANGEGDFSDVYSRLSREEAGGRIVRDTAQFSAAGGTRVWIELAAHVEVEQANRDPSFVATIGLSRAAYVDGDSVSIAVSASHPCTLYLFAITASGSGRLIWPNAYDTVNTVQSRQTTTIPGRRASAYGLVAELDTLRRSPQAEIMLLIAYRGPGMLVAARDAFAREFTINEINALLIALPRAQYAEAFGAYTIAERRRQSRLR